MTEFREPHSSFSLPNIPNPDGALRFDTTQRIPINERAAYTSITKFYDDSGEMPDPVRPEYEYDHRFHHYMDRYRHLQKGATVVKNNFWLEPAPDWPAQFPPTDATSIVGKLDNQPVVLRHDTTRTDLELIDGLIDNTERDIGHARDTATGKERAIRPEFWNTNDVEKELTAINTLSRLGYPVPQNATAHQLFLPWVDTITYDWIPGKDLVSSLEDLFAEGKHTEAMGIAKLFGQHLKEVWQPLLDGTLPDGSVYLFPDNAISNFVYTGSNDPREAFVRIDVGQLDSGRDPLGSDTYLESIGREIPNYEKIVNYTGSLMHNIREGYTQGAATS